MEMIGARKNTLLIGVVTFTVTALASRGTHSEIHEVVAAIALVLEVGLIICSGLGWKRAAVILLAAVALCWLTVFATDSAYQKIIDFLARALSFCF